MKYFEEYSKENNIDYDKIIYKNGKYYIDNVIIKNNRAIHNDIVYYNQTKVINIKERTKKYISGILLLNNTKIYGINNKNNKIYLFKPLNSNYPNFLVSSSNTKKENIYIIIEFLKWPITSKYPYGQCINQIGTINDYENTIKCYLYKNNLFFSKIKINEICNDTIFKKKISNDFTYNIFTIDPENCKDIDDGISFNIIENGYYKLGIHITDVSYYINNIDIFEKKLTSSIYYGNKQINMLPNILSENLCSLLENTIKKCISLIIIFDNNYKIIKYNFELNQVFIYKNFTYDEADRNIKNKNKKYNDLLNLWNFIIKYNINIKNTHELIENLMVLCNKIVAENLYNYDKDKTILRTNIKKTNNISKVNIYELQNYLNKYNFSKASYIYNNNNYIKHDALNLEYYTHFTSPIRRFIDIINHINIKNMLLKKSLIKINYLEKINNLNENIKKYQNDFVLIEYLYNNNTNINHNNIYNGYIINISLYYLTIYIPDLNLEYKYKFLETYFKNLYTIYFINNNIIKIKDINNNIIIYNKYQNIKLYIYILNNEYNIFNKIKINLIH